MKVLQICAYAAQYGGNFIASLKTLEQNLRQFGVVTEYLFPEQAKHTDWCKELEKTAKVHFAGMNRFHPKTYHEVRRAMEKADIVHSHFELYDCITAIALKKHQRLIWHMHDAFDDNIDFPHRVINKIQYGLLSKKAYLISPCRYYADYVEGLGALRKNVCVISNCIDFSRLNKASNSEKKYDFLIFGGFYEVKGLDIVMEACRLLCRRKLDYRIGVVGYAETWKFLESNYADVLHNVVRIAPRNDISTLYHEAAVFLSASRRESFSYALAEALYLGLPAIISDIPGTAWAGRYESVFTVPCGQPTALADAMERHLKNDCWYGKTAAADVSADVEERYEVKKWAAALTEVYLGEHGNEFCGNDDFYAHL